MDAGAIKSSETSILRLEGRWTIERAAELKHLLAEALRVGDSVIVELDGLSACDLSCLQLLCSAHRTSLGLHKQLLLQGNKPDVIKRAVQDAGFSRTMGCDKALSQTCLWTGDW